MSGVNSDSNPWSNYDLERIAKELHVPSALPGRTPVQLAGIVNPAVAGSIYTVTPGKKFYVKSMTINFFTSGAVANSYGTVRDGAITIKGASNFTNSAAANVAITQPSLAEPVTFLTSVYLVPDVGTYSRITYNIAGWEEDV